MEADDRRLKLAQQVGSQSVKRESAAAGGSRGGIDTKFVEYGASAARQRGSRSGSGSGGG